MRDHSTKQLVSGRGRSPVALALAICAVVIGGLVAGVPGASGAGAAASTPSFTVYNPVAAAGTSVAATGTGCLGPAGASVVLASIVSPLGSTVASSTFVPYDSAGDWYGAIAVPVGTLPGDSYSVTASCHAQGQLFAYVPVAIGVTAATAYSLTVGSPGLLAGGSTTVSGANCLPPAGSTAPVSVIATLLDDQSIPVDAAAVVPAPAGTWTATLTVPSNSPPGVDLVTATCDQYLTGQTYAPESVSVQAASVSPQTTVLTYRGATSGPAGSQQTLTAALKAGGVGVAGVPITLSLGSSTVTATTNLGGVARGLVTIPPAGPTSVTAGFAGNAGFAAANTGAISFTAGSALAPTKLALTGSTDFRLYSASAVSAKLSSGGKAVAGRAVTFVSGGTATAALTDKKGVATSTTTFYAQGSPSVGLVFNGAGDTSYASSSTSSPVTVGPAFAPTAIACATATTCTIVGAAGQSEVTTNGGKTWTWVTPVTAQTLASVACPTTSLCLAVGSAGTLLTSTNGGAKWVLKTPISSEPLSVVKCTGAATCVAVGAAGVVYTTSNGGTSWVAGTSGTVLNFDSLSCPTSTTCLALANSAFSGGTFASSNGGATWSVVSFSEPAGPSVGQDHLACTTATSCIAAGGQGATYLTTNGGATWVETNSLYFGSVSCTSATNCLVVNHYEAAQTTDGGLIWMNSYPFYTNESNVDLTCTTSRCIAVYGSTFSDATAKTSTDMGLSWPVTAGL